MNLDVPIEFVQAIELDPYPRLERYSDRIERYYSDVCSKLYPSLSKTLVNDPRAKDLVECMISEGSFSTQFEIDRLPKWFLWRVKNVGLDEATTNLNYFLDSKEIETNVFSWVFGVRVDRTYSFSNDISLIPIKEMPDSDEKEDFLYPDMRSRYGMCPPQAALVRSVMIDKVVDENSFPNTKIADAVNAINDTSLILNCLGEIYCVSSIYKTKCPLKIPFGPFGGDSSSINLPEIMPQKYSSIENLAVKDVDKLLCNFRMLDGDVKSVIATIVRRFSQLKWRSSVDDKFLDLGICLEMLLLNNVNNQERPDQLSLTFRLRGSWLLAETADDRLEIYNTLKKVYNLRSEIAHNGYAKSLQNKNPSDVEELMLSSINIAEQILQNIINNGFPKSWDELILGKIDNEER